MSLITPDRVLLDALDGLSEQELQYVTFRDQFLEDQDLVREVRGADLVAVVYDDMLTSGVAIYALSAGRPILASDTPFFRELRQLVGRDWVLLVEGDRLDGRQLKDALEHARQLRKSGQGIDLSPLDWSRIALQTLDFYSEVVGGRR